MTSTTTPDRLSSLSIFCTRTRIEASGYVTHHITRRVLPLREWLIAIHCDKNERTGPALSHPAHAQFQQVPHLDRGLGSRTFFKGACALRLGWPTSVLTEELHDARVRTPAAHCHDRRAAPAPARRPFAHDGGRRHA